MYNYRNEKLIPRKTSRGKYAVSVTRVDEEKKYVIEIYKGSVLNLRIMRSISYEDDPIADDILPYGEDVDEKITQMILYYELEYYEVEVAHYVVEKAEQADEFLNFDYENERRRRRGEPIIERQEVRYYDYESEEDGTFYIDAIRQPEKPKKKKKEMTPNQLRNLPQYKHLTDEQIMRIYNKK